MLSRLAAIGARRHAAAARPRAAPLSAVPLSDSDAPRDDDAAPFCSSTAEQPHAAYPRLFSPLTLPCGLEMRNRSLMGSMHTGLEEHRGLKEMAAFYAERARGGPAIRTSAGRAGRNRTSRSRGATRSSGPRRGRAGTSKTSRTRTTRSRRRCRGGPRGAGGTPRASISLTTCGRAATPTSSGRGGSCGGPPSCRRRPRRAPPPRWRCSRARAAPSPAAAGIVVTPLCSFSGPRRRACGEARLLVGWMNTKLLLTNT